MLDLTSFFMTPFFAKFNGRPHFSADGKCMSESNYSARSGIFSFPRAAWECRGGALRHG